jgi:phosphate transport system substrate-binding protein
MKNADGQFVKASLESVSAAAAAELPADTDFRVSITNPSGPDAYPIASFTWLLIQTQPRDSIKAAQIGDFVKWMLQPEAQRMAAELHYAPLPAPVIELVRKRVG